jgi:hemerythrin-like metal-binding protein
MDQTSPVPRLGLDRVDEPHRALMDLLDDAIAAFRGGEPADGLQVFGEFRVRCREHFTDEERLMTESEYPKVAEHAQAHRTFDAEVKALVGKIEGGASPAAAALWLESRVASWWVFHIRAADAAVVRHVQLREAEGAAAPGRAAPTA